MEGRRVGVDPDHARAARGYQAEIDARREQERRDEAFARRLQGLGLGVGASPGAGAGAGAGVGVGIYQIHDNEHDNDPTDPVPFPPFFNNHRPLPHIAVENINITSSPPSAQSRSNGPPLPPPVLRRHSQASRAYNRGLSGARAAERVVPAREERGYEREREVFAPLGRGVGGGVGVDGMGGGGGMGGIGGGAGMDGMRGGGGAGVDRMGGGTRMTGTGGGAGLDEIPRFSTEQPRGSALAGLTRGGTAEGRVEEWRRWVEVG